MNIRRIARASALALAAAGAAAAQEAAPAAETVTIDAFSVWSANGAVIEAGPGVLAFAGELGGPYFVDAGEGMIPAGTIACVGALEAEAATGKQTGLARCRLEAADGAVAYGRFACEGYHLVGCVGRFTLTGGEGRLAGASGEGPIVIRRYETTLTAGAGGAVTEQALGVASWKGFTLSSAPAQ